MIGHGFNKVALFDPFPRILAAAEHDLFQSRAIFKGGVMDLGKRCRQRELGKSGAILKAIPVKRGDPIRDGQIFE